MNTFSDVMASNRGHTSGFDYLRLGLAIAVVFSHCLLLANPSYNAFTWPYSILAIAILPAFFALSGFLVSGSLFRNSIPQFLTLRALRIFPALAVEVSLSAVFLGGALTVLQPHEYFTHPMFFRYLLNIFGIIHFQLPGVLGGQILNLQLWTIPLELECYVLIVLVGLVGLTQRRVALAALLGLATIAMTMYAFDSVIIQSERGLSGRVLVGGFAFGMLIYLYRDRLPYHIGLFVFSVVASMLLFLSPACSFLAMPLIAYATIYIGLQNFRPIPFGDLSYGLYLFHFPIAQTIRYLSGNALSWYLLFPMTVLVAGVFAAMSWNFIEKPLLARKRHVVAFVDRLLPLRLHRAGALRPEESDRGAATAG